MYKWLLYPYYLIWEMLLDERGMYAGYRKIPGIFARIPANIRVAAAADNANNLRSSHITKGVYSLYDIATELHEKNTL